MKVELEYSELEERFRTRLLYATASEVDEFKAELEDASSIAGKWKHLVDDADLVDASLEDTKKQFSQTTKQQVCCSVHEVTGRLPYRGKLTVLRCCG